MFKVVLTVVALLCMAVTPALADTNSVSFNAGSPYAVGIQGGGGYVNGTGVYTTETGWIAVEIWFVIYDSSHHLVQSYDVASFGAGDFDGANSEPLTAGIYQVGVRMFVKDIITGEIDVVMGQTFPVSVP